MTTTTIAGPVERQRAGWSARWCWTGHAARPWNQYVYFRRVVELPGEPRRALVRVSADALYVLYVNGQRVHQGPARSYPGRKSYDDLDLTSLLRAGTNVIAAVAHQFGVPTFQSVFRDASGFLLDGVVEYAGGDDVPLHTPAGWTCRPGKGYRQTTARNSIQLGFQEHFDADADPVDWKAADYAPAAEDGWVAPAVWGPVGTHPWLLMEPRGVPLLTDHVEPFAAVAASFRGENPRGYKVADDVYHLVDPADFKRDDAAVENPAAMLADDDAVTTIPPPPDGEFVAVTLDLGTYRSGHVILDLAEAAGDEFLDVILSEAVVERTQLPLLIPAGSNSSQEAQSLRYRCRPGPQRWESFHPIGMRYVLVVFRNVGRPLKVRRLAVRQVHAAFEGAGTFACSDETLNKVWAVARNTQLNCAFDAFVDCPWREMAMWWGDSRVQARVTAFLFGDASLLERGIRLVAQSQTPDGAVHAHPPADIPRHRLPDFMMTFVSTVWDHHQLTGRTDLVRDCLPAIGRVVEFLAAHESPDGLVGSFEGYWTFLDWQPLFKANHSAVLNLYYLQALQYAAELARVVNDPSAAAYDAKAKRLAAAAEKLFWDDKQQLWRDGYDAAAGKPVEQVSQHANTLAILTGLKPETHAAIARDVLLKSARSKRTKVVTASPFFYAYVLEAMAACGLATEVVELIGEKWGPLVAAGASTFPEMWDVKYESRCHAWSSSPAYHLMQIALGVRPTAPGWTTVRIEPRPGILDYCRGSVPTPSGPLRVEWEKAGEDQLAVVIDVPDGLTAEFVAPDGSTRELEAGVNEFHT